MLGRSWFADGDLSHNLLVLRTLCEEGADVNFTTRGSDIYILRDLIRSCHPRYTPTHMDAFKLLLKCGASLTRAMHGVVVSRECIPFIQALLDAGADIEELWDDMTPLTRAASCKNPDVVQALIDAGANVNGAGKLALFAAIKPASIRHAYAPTTVATLTTLCKAGADIKKLNDENHSILSYALTMSGPDPIPSVRTTDTVPAVLEALCQAGADVNFHHRPIPSLIGSFSPEIAEHGDTPLHIAPRARTGISVGFGKIPPVDVRARCIEILISYGADVNAQNDRRQTPVHVAMRCGDFECTKVLTEHGGRWDITDVDGYVPLMLAHRQLKKCLSNYVRSRR